MQWRSQAGAWERENVAGLWNSKEILEMQRKKYVYWQDGNMWLGYLEEYPDYQTQGESLEELKEYLARHIIKMLENETP